MTNNSLDYVAIAENLLATLPDTDRHHELAFRFMAVRAGLISCLENMPDGTSLNDLPAYEILCEQFMANLAE